MKNNLSKSDIRLVANKFQWTENEAKNATMEFLQTPSFANSEEILKICIDSTTPDDRKDKIFESLYNTSYDNLVEHVCNQIINPDPCFDILAVFNGIELKNLSLCKKYNFDEQQFEGSFLLRNIELLDVDNNNTYITDMIEASHIVYSLSCSYLNTLLEKKFEQDVSIIESTLQDIASIVGFRAFTIDILLNEAISYSDIPCLNSKAIQLAKAISSPLDKKDKTQQGYWLIYVVVERTKKKYGLRGAFRKLAELTSQKPNSIQPRYFDRKKIAKKEGLTLDDIIIQYSLDKSIIEIESKLEKCQ